MRWIARLLLIAYLAGSIPVAWSEACLTIGSKTTCSRNAVILRGSTPKHSIRPPAGEAPSQQSSQPPPLGQSGGQSGPRTLAPGVYIGSNGCLHAAGVSVCDWQ